MEIPCSTTWYEPKYGLPESIDKFTQEHRDYIEDGQFRKTEKMFKVVALLK
jgi:hypothetical protein